MTTPLKIIQVIGDSSISGGPRHVLLLAQELQKRGLDQEVICPTGPLARQLEEAKIKVHKIKMRSLFDRKAVHKIREVLWQEKPHLVHCHGTRGGWLGRLAARKIPNLPVVYTEHLWTKEYHLPNPVWEQLQLRGLKFLDKYAQKTIAVSETVKQELVRRKITAANKITVIPNFLPSEIFTLERYKKPKSVGVLIGSIGSLNIQKDFATLISAAKIVRSYPQVIHKQIYFQIIGEGQLQKKLEKQISQAKLSTIFRLSGTANDIYEKMRHFTIYVQSSRSESFGMSAAEAMALKLPVVISNISAFRELIKNGYNGMLFQTGNSQQLARLLMLLIKKANLRHRLAENGYQTVKNRYTVDKVIPQIIAVYEEIIKN